MTTNSIVIKLINKNKMLLEKYKNELIQVVRYWDEDRFVPKKITNTTKVIIKHFDTAKTGDTYFHKDITFTIIQRNNTKFTISDGGEIYIFYISKISSQNDFDSYRSITYQDKTYKELIRSGNTYNHTLSQQKKVEERTLLDMNAGFLTEEERNELLALNYFHDILEKTHGDIVQTKKNKQDKINEDVMGMEIIEEQDWSLEEKQTMKEIISTKEHKTSLFKFYEKLMFLIDAYHLFLHQKDYNNPYDLVGFILSRHIPTIGDMFELPNKIKISGHLLESQKHVFQEYHNQMEELFSFIDTIIEDQHWKDNYLKAKYTWITSIQPKLYS